MKTGQPKGAIGARLQENLTAQRVEQEDLMRSAFQRFTNDMESLLSAEQHTIKQDIEGMEREIERSVQETIRRMNRHLTVFRKEAVALEQDNKIWVQSIWKVVGLAVSVSAVAAFLGSLIVSAALFARSPEIPRSQLPRLGLEEAFPMKGLGGLGRVLVLPEGMDERPCPIGAPRDRLCVAQPQPNLDHRIHLTKRIPDTGKPNPRSHRKQMVRVRCTDVERDLWRAKANALQQSLSGYLRDLLNDTPTVKRRSPPQVDSRLLQQIARAGNNLNQIARTVNSTRNQGSAIDCVAVLTELVVVERVLQELLEDHIR